MNGREHFDTAERILNLVADHISRQTPEESLAMATVALAHATLAAAARDYGLHVEPRKPNEYRRD